MSVERTDDITAELEAIKVCVYALVNLNEPGLWRALDYLNARFRSPLPRMNQPAQGLGLELGRFKDRGP